MHYDNIYIYMDGTYHKASWIFQRVYIYIWCIMKTCDTGCSISFNSPGAPNFQAFWFESVKPLQQKHQPSKHIDPDFWPGPSLIFSTEPIIYLPSLVRMPTVWFTNCNVNGMSRQMNGIPGCPTGCPHLLDLPCAVPWSHVRHTFWPLLPWMPTKAPMAQS